MRIWCKGWLIAGLLLAFGANAAPADDDEEKKVDCGETDLAFEAPTYKVTCYDYSDSSVSVGQSVGATRAAELDANSAAEETFLVVIDHRPVGSTIYLRLRSLRADVEDYFSKGKYRDWKPDAEIDGWEVERFTGIDDGEEMECIGFRRQGSRKYSGISRLTIGLACTLNGIEHAYDALKHLDAPG